MSKYAPGCKRTGNFPYVKTRHSWGKSSDQIVYAANLKEAKGQHGWTRERHTSIDIRRATKDDSATYGWCGCARGVTCRPEVDS